jgi:mRNA interferase HigB
VRIISKAALASFAEQHSESKEPLAHWYGVAKHAAWQNLAEVRRDFPHADPVGVLTVFNIGGRKYRLIAAIKYRWQIIYIRHILTHAEYSQEKWKS